MGLGVTKKNRIIRILWGRPLGLYVTKNRIIRILRGRPLGLYVTKNRIIRILRGRPLGLHATHESLLGVDQFGYLIKFRVMFVSNLDSVSSDVISGHEI